MLARLIARLKRSEPTGLEICALCGADYVNPVDWEAVGEHHWWILLRCGQCETYADVTVQNEMAADFEVAHGRRTDVLERLDREHMAAEAETFIAALRRDRVSAADFAQI